MDRRDEDRPRAERVELDPSRGSCLRGCTIARTATHSGSCSGDNRRRFVCPGVTAVAAARRLQGDVVIHEDELARHKHALQAGAGARRNALGAHALARRDQDSGRTARMTGPKISRPCARSVDAGRDHVRNCVGDSQPAPRTRPRHRGETRVTPSRPWNREERAHESRCSWSRREAPLSSLEAR